MPIEKTCEHCGKLFHVQPKYAHRKFCDRDCWRKHEGIFGRPAARVTPVDFTCRECDKPFQMMKSYVTAYRKKWGKDPMYCSRPCSAIGRKKDASERNAFTCEQCGKLQPMKRGPDGYFYYEQKFCDRKCKADHQRSKAFARFNSGDVRRHVKRHGYVYLSIPSLVTGVKHAVLEHRYIMSQHLGRELFPEETVHHKNGNRQDNALANLELFNSRHGPGQRVVDKLAFAAEMVRTYPELAKQIGLTLVEPVDHPLPS